MEQRVTTLMELTAVNALLDIMANTAAKVLKFIDELLLLMKYTTLQFMSTQWIFPFPSQLHCYTQNHERCH